MKTIILFLLSFSLFINDIGFSQTGWTTQNSGTNYPLCTFYFIDSYTGFAGGGTPTGSIILKTTNGGNSWITNYQSSNPGIQCIKFADVNTGYAVGGYYPNSVILKTTNQGITWAAQNSTLTSALYSVAITDVNTAYIVADWGHIIKTTNGGTSWVSLPSVTTDYLECIKFVNPYIGYAVGRSGQIVKTTNSGNLWFFSVNNSTWLNSIDFVNENTGYTVGQNGKILFTNNGGVTWSLQTPGTNTNLNEVTFINQSTGFISGNSGTILKTTNSGNNWITQSSGVGNDLYSVFFVNENTGYACGFNGTIIKTSTGGMPLIVPTLVYPPNNSTNISLTPALTWTSNPPALYYRVQVSTLSDFSIIVDSATLNSTQRTIPNGKLIVATTYFWRVNATNENGTGPWSVVWNFGTVPVGINQISSEIPDKYYLYNNFPNPFNPATVIRYQLAGVTSVSLKVYNALGREVETLADEKQLPGIYEVIFDGRNCASGIYFYKLETKNYSAVKKMILIK